MPSPIANPIRVLVVDDSAFMRTALGRMISSDPALRVIGTASNGVDAVEQAVRLHPDVVTMDVEMPRMTGLEALSKIMELAPCPVIMVSSQTSTHAEATIEALGRGAYDFLCKDLTNTTLDIVRIQNDLVAKCKAAVLQRRPQQPSRSASPTRAQPRSSRAQLPAQFPTPKLICLGTSTGGPKALQRILPMLPANLNVPIAIVQHMPPGFTAPFAHRLDSLCPMHVKESEANEPMLPGVIYIAAAGQQLRVLRRPSGTVVHMSLAPTDTPHIPSVDILMLSAAHQFSNLVMGVILTGMGNDGQQGMTAIHRAGGYTIGEDESTCIVYGMPRACAEAGILHSTLPLDQIPAEIVRILESTAPTPTPTASNAPA